MIRVIFKRLFQLSNCFLLNCRAPITPESASTICKKLLMCVKQLSQCFRLLWSASDKSLQQCEEGAQYAYLGGVPVTASKRAPTDLTDRPALGDDSPASSPMNSWRPSGT